MATAALSPSVNAKIERLARNADLQDAIINGSVDTVVKTDGGEVDSLAKVVNDAKNYLKEGLDSTAQGVLEELVLEAQEARDDSVEANGSAQKTLPVFGATPPADKVAGRRFTDAATGKSYEWIVTGGHGAWVETGATTAVGYDTAVESKEARDQAVPAAAQATSAATLSITGKVGAEAARDSAQGILAQVAAIGQGVQAAASTEQVKGSWAELVQFTGSAAGVGAFVPYAAGDTGTHIDPVTGATVSNTGYFNWSTSPAGWKRIADDATALKADTSAVTLVNRSAAIAGENDSDRWDYFVDSGLGSDSFDGRSKMKAFKTMAPLTAMTLPTGSRIGLARGSVFYSRLASAAASLMVGAYGVGADPMGDCSDPCPDFTAVEGQTGVFQCTLTLPGDTKVKGNIFAGPAALAQVASLAACIATPGSCYVVNWAAASTTAYVHTATNIAPGTDGLQYRYSARLNFIDLTGDGCVVRGVQAMRNAHQDGAIRVASEYALFQFLSLYQGARHCAYIGANSLIEDCYFEDAFNDLEGSADGPVANSPTVVGKRHVTRRCTWKANFAKQFTMGATHGAAGEVYDSIRHEQPTFLGPMVGLGGALALDCVATKPVYDGVIGGWSIPQGGKLTVTGARGTINSISNFTGAGEHIEDGSDLIIPLLTNGFVRTSANPSFTSTMTFRNGCKYRVRDGKGPSSTVAQFIVHARLILNGSFDLGPAIAAPIEAVISSANLQDNLDGCSYPYGSRFIANGVTYKSLKAYKDATGKQPNSTVKPLPNVLHLRDFTAMSDGYLDGLPGIQSIGTNPNKGRVLSGSFQSDVINSNGRQLYSFGQAKTSAMWARAIAAGAPASATSWLVICATDANNFIGLRWSATSVTMFKIVGGVATQLAGLTVAAPGNGANDEFAIARRDTKVFAYRNGENIMDATWSSSIADSILATGLHYGIVANGGTASGPLIKVFDAGACD